MKPPREYLNEEYISLALDSGVAQLAMINVHPPKHPPEIR